LVKVINLSSLYTQDDKAFQQKKKEEAKAMKEMAAKAAKGGPLGWYISIIMLPSVLFQFVLIYDGFS